MHHYVVFRVAVILVAVTLLLMPTSLYAANGSKPIIVAVIDDGFDVEHEIFNGLVWKNSGEIANNEIDDDANGFVDDIVGWDVSDQDSELLPPESRIDDLDHGTFIAGIIANTIRAHLGDRDDYPIKIMFVKAVSDSSVRNTVEDGYQGIDYAVKAGADIVNLSWSGGRSTREAVAALNQAKENNVFIAASMGNFDQADLVFPLSHSGVFGVSGVNVDGESYGGNLGAEADIAAVASGVRSASARSHSAYRSDKGVSNAVAQVSAAVALMRHENRAASSLEIRACLQSTATAIDEKNSNFPGQFGAGLLNVERAIECIKGNDASESVFEHPEGVLLHANSKGKKDAAMWRLKPVGNYDGLRLNPFFEGKNKKVSVRIFESNNSNNELWSGNAHELPRELTFSENDISIQISGKGREKFRVGMKYAFKLVNQAERFCRSRQQVTHPEIISDGSGQSPYANYSDCEWLVTPPAGHNVALTFINVDTQLHTDVIHLFAGDNRQQRNLLMKLSGKEVPPQLIIDGGQPALLWFVSNGDTVAKGFAIRVEFLPN